MVQRPHQIEALVGEGKALAMAQHRPRQLHARHTVDDLGLEWNEMLEVELVRHLEQRPVLMPALALGMMQRPGGVARQRLCLGRRRFDLEFRPDQLTDGEREGQFPGFQPLVERDGKVHGLRDGGAIQSGRHLGLDGAGDVALHEEALAVVERRQPDMAGTERRRFAGNPEQHPDKILERPRQLDQQIGLVLGGHRVRCGARRQQAGMHVDVGLLQPFDEGGIQADQSVAIVEVTEARPEGDRRGQRGRSHCDVPDGGEKFCSYANR